MERMVNLLFRLKSCTLRKDNMNNLLAHIELGAVKIEDLQG